MIDLDQLDAQLERALTDDVRALRSSPARPTFDRAAPPAIPASTGAPLTLAEKLASIADDLDDLDDPPRPPRAVEVVGDA
ncbi:MAG TPA: hypothetical protein VM390_00525, partial [Acidimicrobiales bacterium]|nr:hypothetical protein [Acidimicrobiales bacterium]